MDEQDARERAENLRRLIREGQPHAVLDLSVIRTEDGGRKGAIFSGYRPQLWLGQRLDDDQRMDWESFLFHLGRDKLSPGESGTVVIFLWKLPFRVLSVREHVEFYEGPDRVATGTVSALHNVPEHNQATACDCPA